MTGFVGGLGLPVGTGETVPLKKLAANAAWESLLAGLAIAGAARQALLALPGAGDGFNWSSLAAGVDVLASLVLGYPAALAVLITSFIWRTPSGLEDALHIALGTALGSLIALYVFQRIAGLHGAAPWRPYTIADVVSLCAIQAISTSATITIIGLIMGQAVALGVILSETAATFAGALSLILALNLLTSAAIRMLRRL